MVYKFRKILLFVVILFSLKVETSPTNNFKKCIVFKIEYMCITYNMSAFISYIFYFRKQHHTLLLFDTISLIISLKYKSIS